MTPTPSHEALAGTAAARRSTRIAFFIAGFAGAVWAALVPFAKLRTGLSDGGLGLLLLCLGAGSIVAMPLAGIWAALFGCRRVIIVSALLICLSLPVLAGVSSVPLLCIALLVFGAGVGSIDCVVNIQAIIVERASGRPIMSGFHGLFSLGGILGAAGAALLLTLGASPLATALAGTLAVLLAIAIGGRDLLPFGSASDGPVFALPHGIVLFIGVLCFTVFLTEGSILDWSAVFLTTARGLRPSLGGLGYAAFAVAMTAGRLTGDRVVRRLGGARVVTLGGLCAAIGFALATLFPHWSVALVGYGLVGLGCSNLVPVFYSAVGRQRRMPEHIAIPAISTLGYAGILAGPAAIGFIAHLSSLTAAFLIQAVSLLGVAAASRVLQRRKLT